LPNGRKPDYRIEGEIFDGYSPTSPRARNIATNLYRDKVLIEQADRIIINLDNSPVSPQAMRDQLINYRDQYPRLKEVIVVKREQVIPIFP